MKDINLRKLMIKIHNTYINVQIHYYFTLGFYFLYKVTKFFKLEAFSKGELINKCHAFSDIEETITNLGGFNTELIVEATVRCLDTIRPGLGLSSVLPMNMAARFRLGASLAQACSVMYYF